MNLSKLIFIVFVVCVQSGFVLLTGPKEAKLPSSEDSPVVQFVWDGKVPELDDLAEFQGGALVGLSNEEAMEALINIAMGKWNEVPGSYLRMELIRDSSVVLDSEDRIHVISVQEGQSLSASAAAFPNSDDDEIFDCDISIASRKTSAKALAYTLLHELGHCVGLGHNHSNYKSVMGYSRVSQSLRLAADDMAGIIYLYPDSTVVPGSPEELVSCGTVQGITKDKQLALWFFILLPLFICFPAIYTKPLSKQT